MAEMGKKMMAVILGVVLAGLFIGYLLPVGMSAINDDKTVAISDQTVGELTEVDDPLNSNITDINTTASEVTVELSDTRSGASTTSTLTNDTETTVTLDGEDIDITPTITSATTADMVYKVEKTYGWTGEEKAIMGVLGIFLILTPLIVLARYAMEA